MLLIILKIKVEVMTRGLAVKNSKGLTFSEMLKIIKIILHVFSVFKYPKYFFKKTRKGRKEGDRQALLLSLWLCTVTPRYVVKITPFLLFLLLSSEAQRAVGVKSQGHQARLTCLQSPS